MEVVLDRARTDEQLGGDLSVRVPLRHEAGDLRFLWGQFAQGADGRSANLLAGRRQFDACALGERPHPKSEKSS